MVHTNTKTKSSTSSTKSYLERAAFSTTTLMWCLLGLIIVTSLVTADTKEANGLRKEHSKNHHDARVPEQKQLKELFSSSTSGDIVENNEQVDTSRTTSERKLVDPSTCTDPEWDQVGMDLDGDAASDRFGNSVALSADGTTLVVGARLHDGPNGSDTGAVNVFLRDSTSSLLGWVQVGQTLYGDAANDWAGYSVAVSADGNIIAFGAPWNDANGTASGHVKVFRRDTSTSLGWSQIGSSIVGESIWENRSGWSIALSANGEVLAIGAPGNNENGSKSGHVRIYKQNNASTTGWSQVGQDLNGNAAIWQCGVSVDLSSDGNIVAFGCSGAYGWTGLVKVFKRDSSASLGWIQEGVDIRGERTNDYFGLSGVALSGLGDIIAIGGPFHASNSGHVRVYQKDSTSSTGWSQLGSDIDGEAAGDLSGYSVAISYSGDIVAIGADRNDGGGTDSGHTRVFRRDPSSLGWVQVGSDIYGESSGDQSGYAVALSANGLVVASGAFSNDNDNGSDSGHVRVYEKTCMNEELAPTSMPSTSPSSIGTESPYSWNITLVTPGYLKQPPIEAGVHDFVTIYSISNQTYDVDILEKDCATPSSSLPLVSQMNTIKDETNHEVQLTFRYNRSVIEGSSLWTSNSDGGEAAFCIKLNLYTDSNLTTKVQYHNTLYTIVEDMLVDFTTDVDVTHTEATDGGAHYITVDENVTAYQCNDSYHALVAPPPLTQYDVLQICVKVEGEDSAYKVDQVRDVAVSQNGQHLDYITSFQSSMLAVTSCTSSSNTSTCMVKMKLLAVFFENKLDPDDLVVTGVVKLAYADRRKKMRKLVEMKNLRNQDLEQEVEIDSSFRLDVALEASPSSGTVGDAPAELDLADSSVGSLIGYGDTVFWMKLLVPIVVGVAVMKMM